MSDIKLGTGITRAAGDDRDAYEVDNPEIKQALRDIGGRIGHALPDGWGFMLLLFDYVTTPKGGATFYLSSADRDDVLTMVDAWLSKQMPGRARTRGTTAGDELNPDHDVTKAMRDQWHKIAALLLMRLAHHEGHKAAVTFTAGDMAGLAGGEPLAVGIKDDADGLTVWLTTEAIAAEMVREGRAGLNPAATAEEKRRYETS